MKTYSHLGGTPGMLLLFGALFAPAFPAASHGAELSTQDPFADAIFRTRDARTGRVSSWDQTGGNADFLSFKAGETKELVRLDGPGVLTHIYVTPGASKAFLRTAVLRMYWDDEQNPSVEVPFGDFFCAGDCELKFQCLGKSDASNGFFLAIDALMLKPAKH